jgi:hypothetical protein
MTGERTKVMTTLWRSGQITGQEGVWCVAKEIFTNGGDTTITVTVKGKPPNCCNSSAARRVSENADSICKQSNRGTSETQVFFL